MRIAIVCVCLGLAACAEPNPAPNREVIVTPAQPEAPPRWAEAETAPSTTGRWTVRWMSTPAPIPENEPFALAVWVLDTDGQLAQVELAVDAAMPEHGHGMNRVPLVNPLGDGGFLAEGLLFHMPGRWELYFDITHGALTERAQVVIELE